MERRMINSFGTLTIPSSMRKELGIDGSAMLWIDVRDTDSGKEIVIRKSDSPESILKKYQTWAEVIARIAESAVSIVWNSSVLSMSSVSETEDYINNNIKISPELYISLKKFKGDSAVIKDGTRIPFLSSGSGNVLAYFRIPGMGDDIGFFIVVGGTRYSSEKVTKADEMRRYRIIKDIVAKL